MAKEVITTLHPEDDITTDLYPILRKIIFLALLKKKSLVKLLIEPS